MAACAEDIRKKEEEVILREREDVFRDTERIRRKIGGRKTTGDPDSKKIIREWRDKDRLARMRERREALK